MFRDHVENFDLTDEILKQHLLETQAIDYLFQGLKHLYELVRQHELDVNRPQIERMAEAEKSGKMLTPASHVSPVIVCAFHWYANTACNWVMMIGWIRGRHDPLADHPRDYLKKVMPTVKHWRDKVSAHFAVHSPKNDTPAEVFASLIPPTSTLNNRLVASAYTIQAIDEGEICESSLQPWSLTEIHEQLCERYGIPLASFQ